MEGDTIRGDFIVHSLSRTRNHKGVASLSKTRDEDSVFRLISRFRLPNKITLAEGYKITYKLSIPYARTYRETNK